MMEVNTYLLRIETVLITVPIINRGFHLQPKIKKIQNKN